ncbi:MAG: ABC transporter permease [Chloroflexia bacterium]|jgi:peptide/nickel transport system permease protein|nr:ABC transporter permease [Chloroflexia bacterium]MDQ3613047.1 ABC transporter permease [Chloroflexota bacterium]
MVSFIIRRLVSMIPVMLMVATGVFLLLKLTPGDPVGVILGPDATEERRQALRDDLGLNDPLILQYVRWLGDAARGDLGDSLFLNQPVLTSLWERAEPTLVLTLLSTLVALSIGLPTGILAAQNRGKWLDMGSMGIAILGISMPTFWLGLNLILIFAVTLRWLPVAGYAPLSEGLWESLRYMILPAITLGVAQAALLARMTRSMMLDVLSAEYVRVARAKGLRERRVVYFHALRNALIPLINVAGLIFAALLGGAVVTEQIFNIPGIGRLLIQAVGRRDVPLVQGTVLVIAAIYVLVNLIVDIFSAVLDPRLRQT